MDLLLHLHLLCSCMLRLLCLSEAEDLGVQLVVSTVKLEMACLCVCTGRYNVVLAVMCESYCAWFITLRLGRLINNEV